LQLSICGDHWRGVVRVTGTDLIIFVIIVQITNVAGAYVYGVIGEKVGFKNTLFNLDLDDHCGGRHDLH
jgi:MFS-type transporter involved in bile tolerance (Atg22 family)